VSTGPGTWTVIPDEDGGPWEIRSDGALIDTARAHYGAWEVLALAERYAGADLAWRLDADTGGFVSA
jgi:hypothetical protein